MWQTLSRILGLKTDLDTSSEWSFRLSDLWDPAWPLLVLLLGLVVYYAWQYRRDGQRLAEFLQDGRLDPSFVPPKEIRQLRELIRLRVSLVQERNRLSNRVEKLLQLPFNRRRSRMIRHWKC